MNPETPGKQPIYRLPPPHEWGRSVRNLLKAEAPAIRTALAVVLPLVVGQAVGSPAVGLMIGLGGLYASLADKEGATWRTMLLTALVAAFATFGGTVAGQSEPLAVTAMFLVAFLGGMTALYGFLTGQIGFIATIVFAIMLGLPGGWKVASERSLEIGVGGVWSTLLTLILWRMTAMQNALTKAGSQKSSRREQTSSLSLQWRLFRRWRKLWRHFTFRSIVFQHAARLAFISALAVALAKFLRLEHGAWLTLTVLVIVKPDYSSTRVRASERVFGTLIGGVIGLLLSAIIHNIVITDILLLLLSVLAYSHQPRNYGVYTVFLTPFVVLLLNIAAPGNTAIALARVTDTLLGGALALFMAYILRPRRAGSVSGEPNGAG